MTKPSSFEELYSENQRLKAVQPVGQKATLYVMAIVILCALTVAGIVAISIVRPPPIDNASLIATIIGVTAPILVALLGAAVQQVHMAVNSRLSQLLELTAKSSKAEGQLVGLMEPVPGAGASDNAARLEGKAAGVEQERARTEHLA